MSRAALAAIVRHERQTYLAARHRRQDPGHHGRGRGDLAATGLPCSTARGHGIAADLLVCGKAIAGGLPCAVYGYTDAVAARIITADAARESGHSGIGPTHWPPEHGSGRS
jgi:hypothetical protein